MAARAVRPTFARASLSENDSSPYSRPRAPFGRGVRWKLPRKRRDAIRGEQSGVQRELVARLAGERPIERRRRVVGDRALPREDAAVDAKRRERVDADRVRVEPPAAVRVDEQQPREVRAQDEMFRGRRRAATAREILLSIAAASSRNASNAASSYQIVA